ncbi:PTS system fructose-specific IIC component [Streptomyces sp. SAI-135]|uniref:fructose-specific PTS transporter subunit EIIC n=1 Tax=unclassified Streptomyces TaxID=2593676 RepID=UPI002476ABC3|nr:MULTISPECIES: fructose-specific PTS transporter subunit EIIC [unclassified Streptomyces]MDH6518648.1 PTS system fructose-specific IIC component [Streptomyces sp. SAI-090]MDH6617257.1 PTS system fructose-specific IIC component [Streptomyces sp. SAI-135]
MTSPAGPPPTGGDSERQRVKLLAVTACPTGIAHTYMAAEKLAQAAASRGIDMKVETQGSIGAENVLDDNDVRDADGIIVAADKDVDLSRFAGKRVLTVGVAEGIHHPERLIEQVRSAPVHMSGAAPAVSGPGGGKERSVGYKALMNGVSYMIPFVVVGGLLIAISLSLGGHTDPSGGLVIPKDSFWMDINNIGVIGFTLMVPILSGYIAYAIGDRPALVPGMIGGWIANTGSLYDSKAGAGFIGAIVTGFLAGYLVLWIKKVKVPKFVQPIMPIIVIPIVATTALGLFFIYVIGKPISWVFEHLTDWLSGMTGTSAILLGAILGLMIAFDMGGPVNKTAFLFGAGLIATGNQTVMGMCAAAIPVMPLGQGLATLIRKRLYTEQERETGLAALFMGCFGISEGAIPFAAARPAQVIPANMLGGAVAGAIAGVAGVEDAVPHGGPIVAVLGAVSGVPMFFVAVLIGTAVTALTTVTLVDISERRRKGAVTEAGLGVPGAAGPLEPALVGVGAGAAAGGAAGAVVAQRIVAPSSHETSAATGAAPDGVRAAAESDASVGTDAEAGTEADPSAQPLAGADTDADVPTVTGAAAGTEVDPSAKPLSSADINADVPTATGTAADTETDPSARAGAVEAEMDAGGEAAAISVAETGGAPVTGPDREVLSGYLTERTVKVALGARDKEAAIREMAELLATTGKVTDVDELVATALRREAQGTTGLGDEIAIPHAKTDAVSAPVVGFARSAEGVEWGSLDGTKARLVFMISVPEAAAGDEHLRILALLSRKLMDAEFRARLIAAPDERAVLDVLSEIG